MPLLLPANSKNQWCVPGVLLCVLGLLMGLSGTAFGQSATTGTITGTVTDPQGAAIGGANVIVHNLDTGSEVSSKSNDAGLYTATQLQPPGLMP